MAIAEMRKLNLVAMSYDKDSILNALQRTGAAEVVLHTPTENTLIPQEDTEELKSHIATVEAALEALCKETENYAPSASRRSSGMPPGSSVDSTRGGLTQTMMSRSI